VRVLLVPNAANAKALEAARELATWLAGSGLEPVLTREDAQAADLEGFGVSRAEVGIPALVVALGGDGTILKAVHVVGEVESPILGVNFGRLGFLTGARAEHMRVAIESALAHEARLERRVTLRVDIVMEGRILGRYRALNEVFFGRGSSARVVTLEVLANGRRLVRFNGDGVVVATATGSTAYALSAGGPIVAPDVNGLVVAPVAAHTLAVRPLVVSTSTVIEMELPDPVRAAACVTIDGEPVPCRQNVSRVVVTQGSTDVVLVRHEGREFFDVAAEEFFGV
jgi:NAD+ kinase